MSELTYQSNIVQWLIYLSIGLETDEDHRVASAKELAQPLSGTDAVASAHPARDPSEPAGALQHRQSYAYAHTHTLSLTHISLTRTYTLEHNQEGS